MTQYNWQKPDWPHFQHQLSDIENVLFAIAEKSGFIQGKLSHLTQDLQTEALIDLMVEEAAKTSAIEGEYIGRSDIRSSIKNKLGLNRKAVSVHDKRAQGIIEMILDMRNSYAEPLTEKKLFTWHKQLLSASRNKKLQIGFWRTHTEPMQIISGHPGKLTIHFEAPPSQKVPREMTKFIQWFNNTAPGQTQAIAFAPIRAAIAHLYFESIHPFEDGNGRIGRAIAEKALSQGFGYPVMLSLSHVIDADKKAYYAALKLASRSLEITEWIKYFVNVILQAENEVERQISFILGKSLFFAAYKDQLSERQLKAIKRMMQAGPQGFIGGMTAKKYMAITAASKATATRDLQHLSALGVFTKLGEGRSARYELKLKVSDQTLCNR